MTQRRLLKAADADTTLARPVPRESVVRVVLGRIRDAIIRKEFGPGDYLPSESELAMNLGVGKTSIREAMKMLQAVGVVDVRQGQGTIIRKEPGPDLLTPLVFQLLLKDGTPTELFEFRRAVEPAYMLMAMETATPSDIAAIEAAVVRLERSVAAGTQTADDDLAFHQAVLEATRNPYMITIGNTILELFRASIERSMIDIPETAARDHRAIFEAFTARDPLRLRDAVDRSFEGWNRSVRAQAASQ